jgi:hypothetical protein
LSRGTGGGAETGVRGDRRGGKAGTACVEVTGIGTGDVEAKELDSPLARASGVVGGAIPTAGATGVGESSIGGREEAKEGRGASGTGDQSLDIGGWLQWV